MPTWEGAILRENRQSIVKYRDTPQSRVGRRMHKFNCIHHVAPMCPCGRTRCCHLSNNNEPHFYSNDAPYVKLLWPLVTFGHAYLDSCTDSQALWAGYCIV